MPVPKQRVSPRRRDYRRAHDALVRPHVISCTQCHSPRLSHTVCPTCGTYNGRDVVTTTE